jgi:prepilin-type N-terminal cleavage/methylation domain-containing protein
MTTLLTTAVNKIFNRVSKQASDMKKGLLKSKHKNGFTIIELMTVMLIISLIIGVLVPGINLAKKHAKAVRQQAQLYSIKSALEMFYNDYDDYPPSNLTGSGSDYTCGAQKLAEALVGCDLQGYDPVSNFDLLENDGNPKAYAIEGVLSATQRDEDDSLARRMGPYLQVDERMAAFDLETLFGPGQTGDLYPGGDPNNKEIGPVLCDSYGKKDIPMGNRTVPIGAPILYFKASRSSVKFDISSENGNIYNYEDNKYLIDLGNMRLTVKSNSDHHFGSGYIDPADVTRDGMKIFYETITNPVIKVGARPHNPDTYILISAGYDGIYGTKDDITNFSR